MEEKHRISHRDWQVYETKCAISFEKMVVLPGWDSFISVYRPDCIRHSSDIL
jgi:hypothetical protein